MYDLKLSWEKYSQWVNSTSVYYGCDKRGRDEFNYIIGALQSESGEAFDALKKATRQDDFGTFMVVQHLPMILEMGDALWYLTRACRLAGITLDELMLLNMHKLYHRFNNDDTRYAITTPEHLKVWPLNSIQPADVSKLIQLIASRITVASASTFMVTGTSSKP